MDIQALVLEAGNDNVKFKKYDNTESTVYTLQKWEIVMIAYANGSKEVFNVAAPSPPVQKVISLKYEKEKAAYDKKMRPIFDNRMIICGFKKRIIVFDHLSLKDKVKKLHEDKAWCTVGIWLNYQKQLVALRLDKDNWDEVIVPFDKFRKAEVLVEGTTKTIVDDGWFQTTLRTKETIKAINIRIVTGDMNTGAQSYTLKLYDGHPLFGNPERGIANSLSIYYKDVVECTRTIVEEIGFVMNH